MGKKPYNFCWENAENAVKWGKINFTAFSCKTKIDQNGKFQMSGNPIQNIKPHGKTDTNPPRLFPA